MRYFLAFCLLTLTASNHATAQEKEVRGFVQALDVKRGTLTVDVPKSGVYTYSLASPEIAVRDARDQPLKLQDIKPGYKISVNFVAAADVAAIKVFPAFKVGTIVSANMETREVELLVKKEKLRFKIAKDAHYYRSERVVAPRELRPGHRITVYYLPESKEVIVINYRGLDS